MKKFKNRTVNAETTKQRQQAINNNVDLFWKVSGWRIALKCFLFKRLTQVSHKCFSSFIDEGLKISPNKRLLIRQAVASTVIY